MMITDADKNNSLNNALSINLSVMENAEDLRIGVAKGEFNVPDDIDKYNSEIADMFIEAERLQYEEIN